MKNKPYVGITGFTNFKEASIVLSKFMKTRPRKTTSEKKFSSDGIHNRILMIGILASIGTLYGRKNVLPNCYPPIDEIKNISICSPNNAMNIIHYSTNYPETLYAQLLALSEIVGHSIEGFQLNIAWPPVEEIKVFKMRYPHKKIILQVDQKALDIANEKHRLRSYLEIYRSFINYVLFDSSDGEGKPFDVKEMLKCLKIAREVLGDDIGLGVAGGLSIETLDNLKPIVKKFPNVSTDIESNLRSANERLLMRKSALYLEKTFEMLQEAQK